MASSRNISVSEEGVCSLHVDRAGCSRELEHVEMKERYPCGGALTSLSIVHTDSESASFDEDNSNLEPSAASAKVLEVEVSDELSSGKDISSDLCQRNRSDGDIGLQELNVVDTTNQTGKKRLEKSVTFPSTENINSSDASVIGISSMLSVQSHKCQDSGDTLLTKSEKAACTRSVSLPSTSKLVSAMKGGREKQGQSPKVKQCVKWAPDVYDPPATSMSHSVKNRQQRPKSRKKDKHKQKHRGSKSPRGNASDKQRSNRNLSATNDHLHHARFHPTAGRLPSDGFSYSGVQMMEYATGTSNESKCGSSFLVDSLAELRFPVAEAS